LRLTVGAKRLQCQFLGVDLTNTTASVVDHFTLDLEQHTVS
jgi:hypothetical protein